MLLQFLIQLLSTLLDSNNFETVVKGWFWTWFHFTETAHTCDDSYFQKFERTKLMNWSIIWPLYACDVLTLIWTSAPIGWKCNFPKGSEVEEMGGGGGRYYPLGSFGNKWRFLFHLHIQLQDLSLYFKSSPPALSSNLRPWEEITVWQKYWSPTSLWALMSVPRSLSLSGTARTFSFCYYETSQNVFVPLRWQDKIGVTSWHCFQR